MQNVQQNRALRNKHATWSGYGDSYIQNIVHGASKVLTLLAVLTFDPGLLFWVKGLQHHLEVKMKEAEEEKGQVERYRF